MAVSPANRNRVYDGQDMMLSVNSFTHPSKLQNHEIQWGFNVITRKGRVGTRYGFRSIGSFVYFGGKAQGISFFTPNTGLTQLVVAVSGNVFVFPFPFTNYSYINTLSFNRNAPYVFFKSAVVSKTPSSVVNPYQVLMLMDGYSRSAYMDGVISRHLDPTPDGFYTPTSIGSAETPVGEACEWAGGRLWVKRGPQIFASDIDDPLHFTENTYIGGGNSLQAIDGAFITALKRTADSKQLIVFTDLNSTRIASNITTRSDWGNTPDFVSMLFPGVGCVGPKAVTDASGELAWMSHDGMRLYNAVGDSVRTAKNNVASREMERSWNVRSKKFLRNACADYRDGYTVIGMPCGDVSNRHMWVMDNSNNDLLSQELPYSWQGVWTGIRPVEIVTGVDNYGNVRTFCLSQDYDNAVRVWEMFRDDQIDGDCDIVCFFDSKGNVFDGESPVTFKKYLYSALYIEELRGRALMTTAFKNEFGCFQENGSWEICATQCHAPSTDCEEGNLLVLDPQRRFIRTQNSIDGCEKGGSPFRSQVGTYHTFRTSWVGRLGVRALKHVAQQFEEEDKGQCPPQEPCKELSCCDAEPNYVSCNSDEQQGGYYSYYAPGVGIITIPEPGPDPEPAPDPAGPASLIMVRSVPRFLKDSYVWGASTKMAISIFFKRASFEEEVYLVAWKNGASYISIGAAGELISRVEHVNMFSGSFFSTCNSGAGVVPDDLNWHHVLWTLVATDPTKHRLYLDGTQVASNSEDRSSMADGDPKWIGSTSLEDTTISFDGKLFGMTAVLGLSGLTPSDFMNPDGTYIDPTLTWTPGVDLMNFVDGRASDLSEDLSPANFYDLGLTTWSNNGGVVRDVDDLPHF